MKCLVAPFLLLSISGSLFAQLQPDQKITDFSSLAALFNKQYAPYNFKRDVIKFDMLKLGPWLDKVRATKDDISFYEVCAAYIASLNDAHSEFLMDTDFTADLGFEADLYDGKAIIDTISADIARTVSFRVGDELVSVDGITVADWLKEFAKYNPYGNPRSTDRNNVSSITFRQQE